MKKFLHLAINPVDSDYQDLVEEALNRATDWIRYLPNCYLIYTGQPAKVWYQRLCDIDTTKDRNFFICEVDLTNRAGWMKTSAWKWINKDRPSAEK